MVSSLNRFCLLLGLVLGSIFVAPPPALGDPSTNLVYMLPRNCQELLPDPTHFIGFFEAVARGAVSKDRRFSKHIFKILSLRDRVGKSERYSGEANPADELIRKVLCFYRFQKDPIGPVPYDDKNFVKYLKSSLTELEQKISEVILRGGYESVQRHDYERQLRINREVIDAVRRSAVADAKRVYTKLTNEAKKKANKRTP